MATTAQRPRKPLRCARPRTYAPSAASSDAPSPPQNDNNGDSGSEYDDREDDLPSSSADKARESTPPINIDKLGRRPSRYRLVYKSPLGLVDVVTGHDNSTGILQDCHLVDRAYAGKKTIVRGFEHFMAMNPGTFNLDGTGNRIFLEPNTHSLMDRGKFVIFPEFAVLRRLLTALEREELSPAEGHEGPIRRNSDGFPHHKDVFPEETHNFHVAPLSTWTGTQPITRLVCVDENGRPVHKDYYWPWEEPLPIVELHCSPYFVVWAAYKWLREPGVHAPAHLALEEDLVLKIGKIMWDYAAIPNKK
ncbi:hypothetical protein K523DRAFT_341415 [Schizophyllum commune Tattone D]|nr:hypothetical protein K523DRAFT_341415 [Schizophyllum commune Tattone D]